MANIHEITLDVKKSGQTINEPIVIRTDDTDDVIKVHLKKDGQPYTDATSATFYGTKQDLTIIANDPATVNGDTITYSVPKELANIGGKIKDAYFMIDGKISTENFVITVFKTVDFKGESKDYIPGLNSLTDKWNSTSKEWNTKLNGLDDDIKNLSMSDMLKQKMDNELETAKSDYMSSFNESVDKLNGVITDLNSKETAATDKGKELDSAINKVNQSIENVNSWLTTVQGQIISANSDFTESQKKSVTSEINVLKDTISTVQETANDLTKQLDGINDEIKAVDVPDLNAKVDSLNSQVTDVKNKYDALKAQLDLATQNISGVRTNLLLKTNEPFSMTGNNISNQWRQMYVLSRRLEKDTTVTLSFDAVSTAPTKFAIQNNNDGVLDGGTWAYYITDTVGTTKKHYVSTITLTGYAQQGVNIKFDNVPSTTTVTVSNMKLEKGPTATDYSLNPAEIATDGSVQTAITNALDKADYSTNAEVDSKISTGVGQAKTYAEQSIKDIIGAAPATLDTIGELADAVTKNKDGVQAINDGITKKADKTDVDTKVKDLQTALDGKIVLLDNEAAYTALKDAGKVDPKVAYVWGDD